MNYGFVSLIPNSLFMIHKLLNITRILVLLFIFLFKPSTIFASSNFTTDYKVLYTVNEAGTTHADLDIVITNASDKFYASSYQMQLGFDNITNIKASDPQGPVNTTIKKTNEGYNVTLAFNKKAVGLGGKMPFKLSFDTDSVAHNLGKIWEIDIPGILTPSDFKTFSVEVKAPSSFGKPSLIKPTQSTKDLIFDKEQLGKSGISIAFGDKQIYDFDLVYHIQNTNLFPTKSEIALPSDTNYQKVFIDSISPKPQDVKIDDDGNWLAQYSLSPAQKTNVTVKGSVELALSPSSSPLSKAQKIEYTSPTKYWQSNDSKIIKTASNLKTPEAIYEFVAKTLKYDFARVTQNKERLGGANVLNNPNSAACREFTDLFITLSRAAGIPAREVNGFAYTENSKQRPVSLAQDILHAWPEFYDNKSKTWIMIDPTWGSTTGGVDYFNVLDFDHFAFAIKGVSDSYPVPAGGYKNSNTKTTKDVSVTYSDRSGNKQAKVDIKNSLAVRQIAGFPISNKVIITNNGPGSIDSQLMYVSSKNIAPSNRGYQTQIIPPFSSIEHEVVFDRQNFLTNKDGSFTIRYAGKTVEQKIKIVPFYLFPWN